ncbi:MAG: hypothetical protein NTZ56_10830 [Acidobacteria bacterium]|nr:hypothetical protein [Acidobacteriota bacterium]
MRLTPLLWSTLLATALVSGQTAPVVTPRGVINGFTQRPAPSQVAPGGIIWISGLNLGPPEGIKTTENPAPTKLGDVEVLVNNRAAGVISAEPGRVVAVVPEQTPNGVVNVIVRRGEQQSRPARITVVASLPSLRTKEDKGFGELASTGSGSSIVLSASGFGAPGAVDLQAYVGGLRGSVTATASDRPGEFDIAITVPADSAAGDMVTLLSGNRVANQGTLGRRVAALKYLPLPDGTPDLRDLVGSDLRGEFLLATGARDDKGCYPAFLFDFGKAAASRVADCLTTANRNAATPIVAANDTGVLGALVGPPESADVVSAKLMTFAPGDVSSSVTLPASASLLTANANGFVVVVPGPPAKAYSVDPLTSEVTEATVVPGAAGGGGGAGGAAGGIVALTIDLGDGLSVVFSNPTGVGNNRRAVVVTDNDRAPKKAKLAFLDAQNAVVSTRDFPEGWLPLAAQPQQVALPPGVNLPPGANLTRPLGSVFLDAPTRLFYVLAQQGDNTQHGVIAFPLDASEVKTVAFPSGWFATGCAAQIPLQTLDLSRRFGLLASKSVTSAFANPCPADGFLLVDLTNQSASVVQLPGTGQLNANAGANEMNDYMFGTNTDPGRNNVSDTLYVLDGVSGSVNRLDLPSGVTGFGNLSTIPTLGALIAPATNRVQGDGGLVLFDLETATAKLLPVPDGFASVQIAGIFATTRKVVGRGVKDQNAGSQFIVYDLVSGDANVIPNPEGVAFVGPLPAVAGAGGGGGAPGGGGAGGQAGQAAQAVTLRANPRAGSIAATAWNAQRRAVGIALLQVP